MNNPKLDYFEKMRDVIIKHEEEGKSPPYSTGAIAAFHTYEDSGLDNCNYLVCTKLPDPADTEDFIKTLVAAGAKNLVINASGDELTSFIKAAFRMGCTVNSVCTAEGSKLTGEPILRSGILLFIPITAKETEITIERKIKQVTHDYFSSFWKNCEKADIEDYEYPYTEGEMCAFHNYSTTEYLHSSEMEVNELPKLEGISGFIKIFREAKVDTLAISDTSQSLIPYLHRFSNLGCSIEGVCKVVRGEPDGGDAVVQAIRIRL